jgi:hypothetical protein
MRLKLAVLATSLGAMSLAAARTKFTAEAIEDLLSLERISGARSGVSAVAEIVPALVGREGVDEPA